LGKAVNLGIKDLFIGVVHLFVIFIPGAFVLLSIGYIMNVFDVQPTSLIDGLGVTSAGKTLLFLALSYLTGHLVSLVASKIEDSFTWIARRERKMKKIEALRPVALSICEARLGQNIVTTDTLRRWCAKLIRQESDVYRADVDAKDADRRFFRNFLLVLIGPLAIAAWQATETDRLVSTTSIAFVAIFGLIILAAFRYLDQDCKFTQLLFESLIALDSDDSDGSKSGRLTVSHAGGVVFRKINDKFEYMLVRAKSVAEEWVLPKGHIEAFETPTEAAVREVREESGEEAQPLSLIGLTSYSVGQEEICIAYYLMKREDRPKKEEVEKDDFDKMKTRKEEERRHPTWLDYETAFAKLKFKEAKSILRQAAKLADPKING
jgi:8-oxo-dGTP pyrophosphatase MutT (NUDIX family)